MSSNPYESPQTKSEVRRDGALQRFGCLVASMLIGGAIGASVPILLVVVALNQPTKPNVSVGIPVLSTSCFTLFALLCGAALGAAAWMAWQVFTQHSGGTTETQHAAATAEQASSDIQRSE